MALPTNKKGAKAPIEKKLSTELQQKAKEAVAFIQRNHIPTFERAGNQQYVFKDSDKNPYVSMFTITHNIDVKIHTDGEYSCRRQTDSSAEVSETFSVSNYNYIIFVQTNQDKVLQTIIAADYTFKVYMQQLLNMPLG